MLKPDGKIRVCIDYRTLNGVTKGDPYYMATFEDIVDRVGGAGVLSTLDLAKGYYQVPVSEGSVDKTAFVSPFG